jgi:hypothetical protein
MKRRRFMQQRAAAELWRLAAEEAENRQ